MGNCKRNALTHQIKSLLNTRPDFSQKLKQRLVLESNKVTNPFKFIASLFNEGVLCDGSNELEANFGLKEIIVQLAIMTACAKGADAIGGLMEALEASGNTKVISALRTWVREDFATEVNNGDSSKPQGDVSAAGSSSEMSDKQVQTTNESSSNNYPVLVKIRPDKRTNEEPQPLMSNFFDLPPPSDELLKVATLNNQLESSTKGPLSLEFNKKRLIAHLADGAVKLWKWKDNEEKTVKLREKVKLNPSEAVTSFQYDEEILVVGTCAGNLYLFDARTLEEKWSVRLGEAIKMLKFVESSIIIRTPGSYNMENVWWVKVSRSNMQLLNPNVVLTEDFVSLNLVNLISTKRVIVAGLKHGVIGMWNTSNSRLKKRLGSPDKYLDGHEAPVVSLCAISGHLISVDQSGKLLMWSGYDLENELVSWPVPRVLAQDFYNVTCLFGYERWFASYSSQDGGIISVWSLPDLWLLTG